MFFSESGARFVDQFDVYYPNFSFKSKPRNSSSSSSSSGRGVSKAKPKTTTTSISRSKPLPVTSLSSSPDPSPKKSTSSRTTRKSAPAVASSSSSSRGKKPMKAPGNWNMSADPEEGIFREEGNLVENSPDATVEICFSFDTTGSMSGYINEVKEKTEQIVKTLLGDLPSIRISIIAHGDYCDYRNYVLKRIDFSNDALSIPNFIKGCGSTGGGDGDECYELVLKEAQSLNWSPSSAKALVVIGDAAPHKSNQYRLIDWEEEIEKLKIMGVKVYGVRCGNRDGFYDEIANRTGGETLELKDLQGITEMVMGLCYREAAAEHARRRDAMKVAAANLNSNGNADGPSDSNKMEIEMESEKTMLRPEAGDLEREEDVKFDEEAAMEIHKAIHSGEREVKVHGEIHKISMGRAGCKFVKIGDETYIEQNKDKSSRYAQMAIEGRKITWIIRKGKWGLIMDEAKNVEATDANLDDA